MSDLHNRAASFVLTRSLALALPAAVVVNTGDNSGIGGPPERFLLSRWLGGMPCPSVLAPGNHDSSATTTAFREAGGSVLSPEKAIEAGGVRFWGYADPNRTRLLIGPRYDPSLCVRASEGVRDLTAGIPRPFVIAVHNELMVGEPPPGCPLVLAGHFHAPRVRKQDSALWVRAGTTGGRSKRSKAMHFAIVDVAQQTLEPQAVWLVEVEGSATKVVSVQL